jgi:hypothetical protein
MPERILYFHIVYIVIVEVLDTLNLNEHPKPPKSPLPHSSTWQSPCLYLLHGIMVIRLSEFNLW